MTIINLQPRLLPKDFASLEAKVKTYQRALRLWAGSLTGNELAVVELLIDRTIGWGRREAYFTIRALIDGDAVYSGLCISERTAYRVLSSLEKRGVIQRRKDPKVPDRVHFIVNLEWEPDVAVAVPKRLQLVARDTGTNHEGVCQNGSDPCQNGSYLCQNGSLYTGNKLQVLTTGNQPGAAAPVSLVPAEKVREIAKSSAAANLTRLAAKSQAPQGGVEAVDAAWRLALVETFPGTAYRTWGVREKAQIKIVLKNWRGDCTFPEFVDWAVRNWVAITKKHFKWMTKEPPPAAPALPFLMAFIGRFADARAEGVLKKWQSDDERTRMERLMAQGSTYEEANRVIAEEQAARGLRKEMEKREIHVRARDHAATRKLAEAAKLAALEGRMPIHPQSELAKRMQPPAAPAKLIEVGESAAADTFKMIPTRNPYA
jgi:hypothetical protein